MNALLIGGAVTVLCSLIFKWDTFQPYFSEGNITGILSSLFFFLVFGFTLSVFSQMGFFAYLTVHRFGLGLFRSFWNTAQVVLILFVLFDIVYFRSYFLLAGVILIVSLLVAYLKNKQSEQNTFISALFFMVVITTLEWLPVLQVNKSQYLYIILITLLVCNAYQLLALPKYLERSIEERKQKAASN